MNRLRLTVLVFATGACLSLWAQSAPPTQITPSNDTGVRALQTYSGTHENINLANGNLDLDIPIVSLPGRNGLGLHLSLQYDSKIWMPHATYSLTGSDLTYAWRSERRDPGIGDLGWRLGLPVINRGDIVADSYGNVTGRQDTIVTLADGGKHSFGGARTGTSGVSNPIMDSEDGSFATLDRSNPVDIVVRQKDGTAIHFADEDGLATKVEDTNGNYISISSSVLTDTLGRRITITDDLPNNRTTISYNGSDGAARNVILNYQTVVLFSTTAGPTYTGAIPFAKPAQTGPCGRICYNFLWVSQPAPNRAFRLLSSITLPNGTAYSFEYNGYGELTKVTYPTGGYTRYDYVAKTHHEGFWSNVAMNIDADFREVAAKHVSPCGSAACEETTTYDATVGPNAANNIYAANNTNVVVTDPLGFRTEYVFSDYHEDDWMSRYHAPRELQRTIYKADGVNPLKKVETTYTQLDDGSGTNQAGGILPLYLPTSVTTTLYDGSTPLVSKTATQYDSFTATVLWRVDADIQNWSIASRPRFIDNATSVTEYHYGASSPGAAARTHATTWMNNTLNATLWAAHIWDRVKQQDVVDPATGTAASTTFEYDSYTEGLTASGAVQHDSAYSTGNTVRGNLTATTHWRNKSTPGGNDTSYLVTRNQYDDAGNIRKTTDPGGHATTVSYADVWNSSGNNCQPTGGAAAAYPTSVTNALGHVTQKAYNSCSGTVAWEKDTNNQQTTFSYADPLDRLTSTGRPDGGTTSVTYASSGYSPVETYQSIDATHTLHTTAVLDGLGRNTQSILASAATSPSQETTYDGAGRVLCVTNWHLAGTSTDGQTCYSYDQLDRITQILRQDGSHVDAAFGADATTAQLTVTDEAGKKRKYATDALGRLRTVWEDPTGGNYETDYGYDILGNLTSVAQKGSDATKARNRSFVYNSLSQLLRSQNPEAGQIDYSYDADGNVLTRLDPRSITTTYGYDALHRVTGKTYSNGNAAVAYYYDETNCLGPPSCLNKGLRTSMTDAAGSTAWSRALTASVGWKSAEQRTTNNVTKTITTQLNQGGSVASLTYPSGRVVTFTPDNAGRPYSAVDSASGGANYATTAAYTAGGLLASVIMGQSATFGGITLSQTYNSRLQPATITSSSAAGTPMSLTYGFIDGQNNGNIQSITNNLTAARSQSFTYDELNRVKTALTQATTGTYAWGLNFGHDAWGNLQSAGVTQGSAPSLNLGPMTTLNRIDTNLNPGFSYDTAGNQTSDGTNAFQYDAENRITTAAGVTYAYDGDGRRVSKSNGKLYWYGEGPDVLVETDGSGNAPVEYVFFGGQRIARRDAAGAVTYTMGDHLGSARVVLNATGGVLDDSDFYPFGGERPVSSASGNTYKFTGKERDIESGLDYFGARYYANTMGCWLSPDWSATPQAIPYADLTDPQTLNLYGYVRGNPLSRADADGHGVYVPTSVPSYESSEQGIDIMVGVGKELINTVTSAINLVSYFNGVPTDIPQMEASNPTQSIAMSATMAVGMLIGGGEAKAATKAPTAAEALVGALERTAVKAGEGVGPEFGTRAHAILKKEITALGRNDLHGEVSYLNGEVVRYGTPGSVRLDTVEGLKEAPTAVGDLKTGGSQLTAARVAEIRAHLPEASRNVPVTRLRLKK